MECLGELRATKHLEWVLAALAGAVVTESAVDERFTDEFKSLFPPLRWIEIMDKQTPMLRPFAVTTVEVGTTRARAELDTPVGPMTVSFNVDAEDRIDRLALAPAGGAGLTPRLPMEFPPSSADTGRGQRLVVVAGVPGTGKSTLADRLGGTLGAPVFAVDWVLGALTPFGGRSFDHPLEIGDELLTTLAYRQLALGQSAILDSPAESEATRARWTSLAAHFGAVLAVIVCRCSDEAIHQERLTSRSRGIPGWHEGGNWDNVRQRRDRFARWDGDHLEVDAARPIEDNTALVLEWLGSR